MSRLLRKLRRWGRREEVLAIADDEIGSFLSWLGFQHQLSAGRFSCHICADPLDLESIEYVARNGEDVVLLCSKVSCFHGMAKLLERD